MALCTICGAIMNEKDAGNHACNPADIPAAGKTKRVITTEDVI